ncbi:hypothetical protein MYAM1_002376 [Malassezia yamatoensis]|uniref:MICOS complex subunit n=1 Tax=Malassezia yamatoensis TaxID=253288 RepID=A0AAJ5YTT5_9BASI|nr:hypothetical protein MYAM1_002376 [Malassezia yamatoensis]
MVQVSSKQLKRQDADRQEKLPIYPRPDPPVTVVETSNELEHQVGKLRNAVQSTTRSAIGSVRSGVDRVVNTEHQVETKDETLAPNALYVGIATLSSIVFTRYRSFPIRWLAPPAVFALSFKYLLPHTFDNTADFYESWEQKRFPGFSAQRQNVWTRIQQTYHTGVSHLGRAGDQARDAISSGIEGVENRTGLRVSSAIPTGTVPESAPRLADKSKLI